MRGGAEPLSLTSGRIGLKLCGSASSTDVFKHENSAFKVGEREKGIVKIPVSYPSFHISLFDLLFLSVSVGKMAKKHCRCHLL